MDMIPYLRVITICRYMLGIKITAISYSVFFDSLCKTYVSSCFNWGLYQTFPKPSLSPLCNAAIGKFFTGPTGQLLCSLEVEHEIKYELLFLEGGSLNFLNATLWNKWTCSQLYKNDSNSGVLKISILVHRVRWTCCCYMLSAPHCHTRRCSLLCEISIGNLQ